MDFCIQLLSRVGQWLIILLLLCTFSPLFAQSPEQIALQHLQSKAASYDLTPQDVGDMIITDNYTSRLNGVSHVYFRQAYRGIGIFQANVNVNVTEEGRVISMGVACLPDISRRINTTVPTLGAADAVLAATSVYNLGAPEDLVFLERPDGDDMKGLLSNGKISQENIPVRLMYVEKDGQELRLCWDLSILTNDGSHWWSLRIDALNGRVLSEFDWMTTCNFDLPEGEEDCLHEHILTDAASSALELHDFSPVPLPAAAPPPNSYNVYADPLESPNHGARTVVSTPWNLTASPFGWHDDNGVAGAEYTFTRGNNVLAQDDQNGNNGNGLTADGGATLDFNFAVDLNQQPNTYLDAALTNLFFWNNRIHDVFYLYGFDEQGGNFQENNYGNGAAGSDFVFADCQDGSGVNNANFGTPPDGQNPRMQMFLWTGQATTIFDVNSPATIAGNYNAVEAGFGPALPATPITGNLVIVDDGSASPSEGCNALTNGAAINFNIALVDRGNCNFTDKVLNAQNAGAVACIVCNNAATAPFAMGGNNAAIVIPSVMISQADCAAIRAEIGSGVNVSLSGTGGAVDKDGDFDNGIIAHEYGHGVSNRLVGGRNNTSCLGNAEQMGEGWSDWIGLIMTIEPGDAGANSRGIGTFAISQPTSGAGIRPAPYSTDMTINPFTYGDITNTGAISQPHGVGFLWCNMIWEMTWALIDQFGFDPDLENGTGGNNIAMRLVVDGMALLNCNPGMQDGRDAILQADTVNFGGIHSCLIWEAFAKRGMGFSASQGSAGSRTDGSEAFDIPPFCTNLPVEWAHLTATAGSKDIVVDWEVSMEEANRGFEVQRRANFEEDFSAIGFVDSKGESNQQVSYGYLDNEARPGILYEYRLLQVDLNGLSSYSNTVAAMITPDDQLLVELAPNPAGDRTTLRLDGELSSGALIEVKNLVGQTVLERNADEGEARTGIELNLSQIPAGQYLLQVTAGGVRKVEKLVVR